MPRAWRNQPGSAASQACRRSPLPFRLPFGILSFASFHVPLAFPDPAMWCSFHNETREAFADARTSSIFAIGLLTCTTNAAIRCCTLSGTIVYPLPSCLKHACCGLFVVTPGVGVIRLQELCLPIAFLHLSVPLLLQNCKQVLSAVYLYRSSPLTMTSFLSCLTRFSLLIVAGVRP